MFDRRNYLIKSITALLYFSISGCVKAVGGTSIRHDDGVDKLYESPNFDKVTNRFQHPSGDLYDKSFGDVFDFFTDYFRRPDDEWETTGFPVLKSSSNKLSKFSENVVWVGESNNT